jgi:ABC-type nitrate/sulfonate/bicarbonate transport system ATPase subunit
MTVLENLEMGGYSARGRSALRQNIDRIFSLFPVLAERRSQLAGTLSGGEQQMLAIGRGIASSPRLLLLDEPSMGLAPAIADLIFDRIAMFHREDGVTLLLVEQRVAEALESCDYARNRPRRPRRHASDADGRRSGAARLSRHVRTADDPEGLLLVDLNRLAKIGRMTAIV